MKKKTSSARKKSKPLKRAPRKNPTPSNRPIAIDASVVLELADEEPSDKAGAARWANVRKHVKKLSQDGRLLIVPAASLAELSSASNGAVAMLQELFSAHVLNIAALDDESGEIAARIMKPTLDARPPGVCRHCVKLDVLIYATAIATNCEFVATANARHFETTRRTAMKCGLGRTLPSILDVGAPPRGQFELDL